MRLEYLCKVGHVQYKGEQGPVIVNCATETQPAADLSQHPALIQAIANALWVIPETRTSTQHRHLSFNEADCTVQVDGRALPPGDVSTETPEVQAFHSAVYNFNGGEYAKRYAALEIGVVEPTEPPAALTPEQEKALAVAEANKRFQEEIAAVKAGYTEDEITSWNQQKLEAESWAVDNTYPTPLLDAILSTRGTSKEELVSRIIENSKAYTLIYGRALGRLQKTLKDLEAA